MCCFRDLCLSYIADDDSRVERVQASVDVGSQASGLEALLRILARISFKPSYILPCGVEEELARCVAHHEYSKVARLVQGLENAPA